MRQPTRPLGRSIRCSSSSASSSAVVDLAPRAGHLLVARLGAVGVVRGGEHRVGDFTHPTAVEADRGIEQYQAGDQLRPGRRQMQCHRTAERMGHHHNRFAGFGSSRPASAATLASMVHGADHDDRPWPIRSGAATAASGRCSSASVCQRRPWPVNPWIARTRGARADRSGAREARSGSICRTAALSCPLGRPPTPVADSGALPIAGARTWGADAATVLDPGLRGIVRVLGGPGTGKTSLLIDAAAARIGAGADPESVLLLTGSGRLGARTRGALTAALLSARPRRRAAPPCVSRWSAPCTPTRSRCCGWPRSARAIRRHA